MHVNKVWGKVKFFFLPFTNPITIFSPAKDRFSYEGHDYIHYSSLAPDETAFFSLSATQKHIILYAFFLFSCALAIDWHRSIIIIFSVITTIYFVDLLFNLALIYLSFSKEPEITITKKTIRSIPEKDWPMYTVFCPLYNEVRVLSQFINAMKQLDYPKEKLQVMLLLEEDDAETIKKIRAMKLPKNIDTVIVPQSKPKTKPKALNYGLLHAKGKYCVIYDAEDIPEKEQLKKAVLAFSRLGNEFVCIQAKLNFYNPHQNLLTKAFTSEYSLWFDLVLTGLQSIHAPIPLGGTSNHFRIKDIKLLKGWDSFNVTEDCDLGMRLVKRGYRTAVINSITLEEANSATSNWFGQRTRWIKGYMQTYFIHMRKPKDFIGEWKRPHVITFQLVVGGKVLSMFINPMMWCLTVCYFLFRAHIGVFIESFFPAPILYMGVFSLLFGNFLYMYYYMLGCAKHGHYELVKYAFLVPFYWLAMSVAAWTAVYEFIKKPHYWSKTKHGLHLLPAQSSEIYEKNSAK